MKIPVEISFRDVRKTEAIEALIREKAAKLDKVCDYITSCRIFIGRPQHNHRTGNSFRVRIDMRVPPNQELVVRREATDGNMHEGLITAIQDAFSAARRQLQRLVEKQREEVKIHPGQEVNGIVAKLFRDDGYGFIQDIDGGDIYFHKNSVLHGGFDRLEIGTGVRFNKELGEKGPQASTVQIISKAGSTVAGIDEM